MRGKSGVWWKGGEGRRRSFSFLIPSPLLFNLISFSLPYSFFIHIPHPFLPFPPSSSPFSLSTSSFYHPFLPLLIPHSPLSFSTRPPPSPSFAIRKTDEILMTGVDRTSWRCNRPASLPSDELLHPPLYPLWSC